MKDRRCQFLGLNAYSFSKLCKLCNVFIVLVIFPLSIVACGKPNEEQTTVVPLGLPTIFLTGTSTSTAPATNTATQTPPPPTSTFTQTISLTPTIGLGSTSISERDGVVLVHIPASEFIMGLTPDQAELFLALCEECEEDDFYPSMPAHRVYLDSYWIYLTEVTNKMYRLCVSAGECNRPVKSGSQTRSNYYGNPDYDNFPVVFVSWYDAERYCSWAGGRLPTEAEWEKAARGRNGRLFPWGDQAPNTSLTNTYPYNGDTTKVGSYPNGASPYGVLDMVGNVYEWIADWYRLDYYQSSDVRNPLGPQAGESGRRCVRGGSWGWGVPFASSAFRDWWEPGESGSGVGFRCVKDVVP